MKRKLRNILWRYGLASGLFIVALAISILLSHFSIQINLTILIAATLVIASWYGGRGPGLLVAVLMLGTTILSRGIPADATVAGAVFGYFSVFSLLVLIVLLVDSRKRVEKGLRISEARYRRLSKKLEQKVLDRTAELETVNKELETFSYSVSHDLRAPLRSIDGFSLCLLEDCGDQLDDTGKKHLKRIRASSKNMANLIEDLLALSRLTRREMNREEVNLSKIVREIIKELKVNDSEREIEIEIQKNVITFGDKKLLKIALENLLGNAWKFTSKKGSEAVISFGKISQDDKTEYFVKDNGAGFDMKYADKLFGAFQRLHSADDFEGTGIGLATVHRILQRHGGSIRAESKVEQGAGFYFTL